jgi:hypothetical protein
MQQRCSNACASLKSDRREPEQRPRQSGSCVGEGGAHVRLTRRRDPEQRCKCNNGAATRAPHKNAMGRSPSRNPDGAAAVSTRAEHSTRAPHSQACVCLIRGADAITARRRVPLSISNGREPEQKPRQSGSCVGEGTAYVRLTRRREPEQRRRCRSGTATRAPH